MEVNGAPELLCFPHSSEYLPLCSAEQRHSYRFGTTWGWVNDDRIFIFGWTIPLKLLWQIYAPPSGTKRNWKNCFQTGFPIFFTLCYYLHCFSMWTHTRRMYCSVSQLTGCSYASWNCSFYLLSIKYTVLYFSFLSHFQILCFFLTFSSFVMLWFALQLFGLVNGF